MNDLVFPPVERVAVPIPSHLRQRFEDFVREKGWTLEEGVRILLAYGADALTRHRFTPEETYNEWAAARAEYAVLRHRAYIASEAIRTLTMNIAGLKAKNAQFERSLQQQYARRERLRQALEDLEPQLHHPASPVRGVQAEKSAKGG